MRSIFLITSIIFVINANAQIGALKDTIIQLNEYNIAIDNVSKSDFETTSSVSLKPNWILKEEAVKLGRINIFNGDSVSVKLKNGKEVIIKKSFNSSFYIEFLKYEPTRGVYVFYEEWYEGWGYFMISDSNGKKHFIYDRDLIFNSNNYMATGAIDILAEWSNNGIQIYDFSNTKKLVKLFDFDPITNLKEHWGVLKLKWIENNTVLIQGEYDNWRNSSFDTIYKRISFEKH